MGSQFEKDTNSKFLGQCLFSEVDHHVVREGLKRLSEKDRDIVLMRFWENCTLAEIGSALQITSEEVESRLKASFVQLKEWCTAHPRFTRHAVDLAIAG